MYIHTHKYLHLFININKVGIINLTKMYTKDNF